MSLREKIRSLSFQEVGQPLSEGVQRTLRKSHLDEILDELLSIEGREIKLSKEILEGGNKLLVVVHWPSDGGEFLNQIILSVRAERLTIIAGSDRNNNYVSLEGQDRFNRGKIEDVLAKKFLDPTRVSQRSTAVG